MKKYQIFRILVLSFTCCIYLNSFADVAVRIDMNKINKKQVLVLIQYPKNDKDTLSFGFYKIRAGSYVKHEINPLIQSISFKDNSGKELNFEKAGNNIFNVYSYGKLSTISYVLKNDWNHAETDRVDRNYIQDSFCLLNISNTIGVLEGFEDSAYQMCVEGSKKLKFNNIKDAITNNEGLLCTPKKSYFDLVANPLFFTNCDTIWIQIQDRVFSIFLNSYNEFALNKISLRQMISPIVEKLISTEKDLFPSDYSLIFCLGPSKNCYSLISLALEHPENSVYSFPFNPGNKLMSKVIAHELLHNFTPLSFRSDSLDFLLRKQKGNMSKHLWLYEGMTEYLALKLLFQAKVFDTSDFFTHLANGYVNSVSCNIPLTSISQNIFEEEMEKNMQYFYTKGAVICFLLDMAINENSGGIVGLFDILKSIALEDPIFKEDDLIKKISEKTNGAVDSIFQNYLLQNKSIPFEYYLAQCGYSYTSAPHKSKTRNSISSGASIQINKANIYSDKQADTMRNLLKKL
ncbi:M61 family metallopeptidase [Chryseobacterium sp.]|uniref:M61 family metallopeptidase n=1 Tax=Chryseobacterium sp. TaxID=1871047 RepID=UPI002FC6D436